MEKQEPWDPRRVWIPTETRGRFEMHDGIAYQRSNTTGSIRLVIAKSRGKAARRADKQARRNARQTATATKGAA